MEWAVLQISLQTAVTKSSWINHGPNYLLWHTFVKGQKKRKKKKKKKKKKQNSVDSTLFFRRDDTKIQIQALSNHLKTKHIKAKVSIFLFLFPLTKESPRNVMYGSQFQITSLRQLFHLHVGKPEVTPASSDLFSLPAVSLPLSPSVALPLLDHFINIRRR